MTVPSCSGCFITGTDTGVGKTVITAALAFCLKRLGLRVAAMKPVETGYSDGDQAASDAEHLRAILDMTLPLDLIAPYRLALPLAPLAAAQTAGVMINMDRVTENFHSVANHHDFVLVEGVGGLMVPLSDKADIRDLIAALGLPVIIIGRAALGGVNHALLTLEALRQRAIPVIGLVLNHLSTHRNRMQTDSTVDLIRQRSGVPVFGPLPYEPRCREDWMEGVRTLAEHPVIRSLAESLARSTRERH